MKDDLPTYRLKRYDVTEEIIDRIPMHILKGRPRSICELLQQTVAKHPDREGFVDETHRWTFAQFERKMKQLAVGLRTRVSVKKGDRVAMLMETGVPYTLSLFAVAETGAISVPLNSRFTPRELAFEVENSGSRVIIVDETFLEMFLENRDRFRSLEHIIVQGEDGPQGTVTINELLDMGQNKDFKPVPLSEDDLVMIMYTSGTTGFPKGAMQTHRGVIHACMLINDLFEAGPQDKILNALPMFHAAGTIMSAFSAVCMGIPCIYLPKFKTDLVLEIIEKEKITLIVHVPTVFWLMANHKDLDHYNITSLHSAIVGGAPKSREAFEFIMKKLPGVQFADTFGMTETHSMDFVLTHEEFDEHMKTVGRRVPVVEVQVTGKDGTPCAQGEPGQIQLRGPKIMKGYWNNPEATRESIKDGWFLTGDVGRIDEQGYVHILDRIKDMINRGGENIYSVEVENALRRHPSIDEVAVVGVPDSVFGEEVKAYVTLKPDKVATVDDLKAHCKGVLADYKVPRYVDFIDDFPRNPTGKILKKELRRQE
jgi:acyl-CoA synthetase (AMP-forming)/AMP-acid ligase II